MIFFSCLSRFSNFFFFNKQNVLFLQWDIVISVSEKRGQIDMHLIFFSLEPPLNCGKGIVKVKRERRRRKGGKEKRKEGDRGKSREDGESRAAATFRKLKRRWRVIDLADPRKPIAKTREEKPRTNPTTAGSSRGSESSKTRN